MTPRLKKLLIACHPDRHGGDHSRMEDFFRAAQRPKVGVFRCVDCSTTVGRKGTRCGVCFQAKRRIKKALPVALFLLCALCASVANAIQMPPPSNLAEAATQIAMLRTNGAITIAAPPFPAKSATLATQPGSAPALATNTTQAITTVAAPLTGTIWKGQLNDQTRITVKSESLNGRINIERSGSDTNTDHLIVWAARKPTITTEQLTNHFTILTNTP